MKTVGTFSWGLVFAALPALAQPALQFTAIRALASNQVELVWSSDVNRLFAIERTADPGDWDNALCVAIPEPSAQFASNRWAGAMDTTPAFFRLLASPPLDPSVVCHTDLGTPANDTQIVIGTTNRDYVMQFGNAGNDMQYASGGGDRDWIVQYGGPGIDNQFTLGGTSDDCIYQFGGDGNDKIFAIGDDGDDWIIQHGGDGDDNMETVDGTGDDHHWQNGGDGDDDMEVSANDGDDEIVMRGGAGHDTMRVNGGLHNDLIEILGGDGDDRITYETSPGLDDASIDGGADTDTLIVREVAGTWKFSTNYLIKLGNGTELYTSGVPDTVITVTNVEFISVVGTNGLTNWSWTAP